MRKICQFKLKHMMLLNLVLALSFSLYVRWLKAHDLDSRLRALDATIRQQLSQMGGAGLPIVACQGPYFEYDSPESTQMKLDAPDQD
jgi:hypothetical protein